MTPCPQCEIEVCAQYVHSSQFLQITDSYILFYIRELCEDHALFVDDTDYTRRLPFWNVVPWIYFLYLYVHMRSAAAESESLPDDDIGAVMIFICQ